MKKTMILLIFLLLTACVPGKTTITKTLMDTNIEITAFADEQTINKAFDEIERIEKIMNIYDNESEIYKLNKEKILENASDNLLFVINKSIFYSELSNGSFDITVQPILDLYKQSFTEKQQPPTEEEIQQTLRFVDYRNIEINERTITLRNNAKLTLGGIAKGYAIDKAIEVLQKNNVKSALINAGGDLKAIGKKYGQQWTIALQNPNDKFQYIDILKISNKAVATSGNYERYFDENKKFHHIVNPKTGYSADELISVTVVAETALDADAIATAVFVLGNIELCEKLDVECLIITKEKEIKKN